MLNEVGEQEHLGQKQNQTEDIFNRLRQKGKTTDVVWDKDCAGFRIIWWLCVKMDVPTCNQLLYNERIEDISTA